MQHALVRASAGNDAAGRRAILSCDRDAGRHERSLYIGNTVVLLPRWDRVVAAECMQRHRVASWTAVPTMIQDFFANPDIERYDLSSIRKLNGGGAGDAGRRCPAAEESRHHLLRRLRIDRDHGGHAHQSPGRPKPQCLGIPIYGVESRVIDPLTLGELPAGAVGEIVTHGPQVFLGYWNKFEDTARAFVEIDGKRFLRTGDLGRVDEDGYFFMVDRLKRMINASGFKVWPTEVESLMYQHPAVLEACVIAASDAYRGETVKALVVLRPEWRGRLDDETLIEWCRGVMAAYKVPRIIAFVDALPKSGSGKIQWRELQAREAAGLADQGARS